MCKTELILKDPGKDRYKIAPLGYSWTVLFFSFLVPLCRRDWRGFAILLSLSLLTLGTASPVCAWFYNTAYARHLLKSGYKIFHIKGNLSPAVYHKITAVTHPV